MVGTVNEDFAIESMPGDIFQLGISAWRILRLTQGKVLVEDAHGQPPTIPFWLGEAPAPHRRALRAGLHPARRNRRTPRPAAAARPRTRQGPPPSGSPPRPASKPTPPTRPSSTSPPPRPPSASFPTQQDIVLERFFDESGGMQLVPPRPLRRAGEPRLGPRPPQEVLPRLQPRAPGRRHRGQHRPLARPPAQLPFRRRLPLPERELGPRRPHPSPPRRAHV